MTTRYLLPRKIGKYLLTASACLILVSSIAQTTGNRSKHPLYPLIDQSAVFSRMFTGFYLLDPQSGQVLYEKDADKYYTPASNTKLLTFYTALKVLGDSLPAMRYMVNGDTLIFWGTGNPLFLHPDLPQDSLVFAFLQSWPGPVFFSSHNFKDDRFGPGWSWGDYAYAYQAERTPFPVYGNQVRFRRSSLGEGFEVNPPFFKDKTRYQSSLPALGPIIRRLENANLFEYNGAAMTGLPFSEEIPFHFSPDLLAGLLSDTLKRPIQVFPGEKLPAGEARTIQIALPDTLYRRLMQDSDNFIAEQLMLAVSDKLFGVQNIDQAIRYAQDSLLAGLPDRFIWVDGSGLSRYNLFTPRSVVGLLQRIYPLLPEETLFAMLPAGGVRGTIQNWYPGPGGKPFVFAKTGTLSNKHSLSGYLRTRKNKLLFFSFMHNNYIDGSSVLKAEMNKVLQWVFQNY